MRPNHLSMAETIRQRPCSHTARWAHGGAGTTQERRGEEEAETEGRLIKMQNGKAGEFL